MIDENQDVDKPNTISNSNQKSNKTKAKRLTFSYENTNIKLIDQQELEKIIPQSTSLTELENRAVNFWLEITDKKKKILYRQVIENPIKTDIEVFSDQSNESIIRKELSEIKGVFSIVIPDAPQAESLDFFSRTLTTNDRKELTYKDTNKIFHLNLKSSENKN